MLGRYFHPGPSTRGRAQAGAGAGAGAGDHFTVTADGDSSVLTTAPVSAGTPHTLDISTHYISTSTLDISIHYTPLSTGPIVTANWDYVTHSHDHFIIGGH